MSSNAPVISVLIAVHNGEKFLSETLDSVISQTFTSWECIVVDDYSTDTTPQILREYAAKDERFIIHTNEKNLRLAASLNAGLELARGKYTVRLDADDISLPDRFEKQYAYMESHPEVTLSYPKHYQLKREGVFIAGGGKKRNRAAIPAAFLFFCPVLHPGVIVKTDVIRRYGYNPAHTCSEDMELWTRMIMGGEVITCQDEFLVLYRIHDGQITADSEEKQKKEVREIFKRYYTYVFGDGAEKYADFVTNDLYFCEKKDLGMLKEFYRHITKINRERKILRHSEIVSMFFEVTIAIKHEHGFTLSDILRLGGIIDFYILREHIAYYFRLHHDIVTAARQAKECGFELKGRIRRVIPYYKYRYR